MMIALLRLGDAVHFKQPNDESLTGRTGEIVAFCDNASHVQVRLDDATVIEVCISSFCLLKEDEYSKRESDYLTSAWRKKYHVAPTG